MYSIETKNTNLLLCAVFAFVLIFFWLEQFVYREMAFSISHHTVLSAGGAPGPTLGGTVQLFCHSSLQDGGKQLDEFDAALVDRSGCSMSARCLGGIW